MWPKLVLLVCAVLAPVGANVIAEFSRRAEVVASLGGMYARFLEASDETEGRRILAEFNAAFQANFDDSDRWLLAALVDENDTSNAVQQELRRNKFHYRRTEEFLRDATAVVEAAAMVNYHYHRKSGNDSEAARSQRFLVAARQQLVDLTSRTLLYLREVAWRSQYRADATALINRNPSAPDLQHRVHDLLADKFPFRNWFVLVVDAGASHFVCPDSARFDLTVQGRRVLIAEVATGRASREAEAMALLENVSPKRTAGFHTCRDRPRKIYEESKYSCDSRQFPLFVVFKKVNGLPALTASDLRLVHTKTAYRARLSVFCRSYYRVIIFG